VLGRTSKTAKTRESETSPMAPSFSLSHLVVIRADFPLYGVSFCTPSMCPDFEA